MPSTNEREGWFDGTWALVRSRRHFIVGVPLAGVLAPGVVGAVFAILLLPRAGREIGQLMVIVAGGLLTSIPLVLGAVWTLGPAAPGLPGRRQELLGLPLGRLAIPGAVLVGSGLAYALAAVAAALMIAVVSPMLTHPIELPGPWATMSPGHVALAAVACASGGFLVGAVGGHAALATLLLVVPAVLSCAVAELIGHPAPAAHLHAWVWLAAFTVYGFALPVLLYARAPHHWAIERAGRTSPEAWAVGATAAAWIALLFAGWAAAAVVLAAGASWVWRSHRKLPAIDRRPRSHLRVSYQLALGLCAPLVAGGLVADAALVSSISPDNPAAEVADQALAPDGRRLAAELRIPGSLLERVTLVDLTGEHAPVLIGGRSAKIAGWSSTGRYLAVYDYTLGRLTVPPFLGGQRVPAPMEPSWLARATSTLIADVETGEIVTHRPALLVAPGWADPSELLRIALYTDEAVTLADGRGRHFVAYVRGNAFAVPLANGGEFQLSDLTVVGYADERPLLWDGRNNWSWGPAGVDLVGASRWRYIDADGAGSARVHTLGRGAERVELGGYDDVDTGWSDGVLAVDATAVWRVHLPGRTREQLVPRRAGEPVTVHRVADAVVAAMPALADARLVWVGSTLYVVPPIGPATPVPEGTCARRLALVSGGPEPQRRLLGIAADGKLVTEALALGDVMEAMQVLPDGSILVRSTTQPRRPLIVRRDGTTRSVLGG